MAGEKRQKDQEMAQRLKAEGVRRTSSRCCICYEIIGTGQGALPDVSWHVSGQCKGPRKVKGSGGLSAHSVFHPVSSAGQ